jgi:starch synthase
VRLLIAGLPAIAAHAQGETLVARLPDGPTPWGHSPALPAAAVSLAKLPDYAAPIYLLRAPALLDRPGNPYQGPDGQDWPDNPLRFAALSWAAATLGQGLDRDWQPDIIRCWGRAVMRWNGPYATRSAITLVRSACTSDMTK